VAKHESSLHGWVVDLGGKTDGLGYGLCRAKFRLVSPFDPFDLPFVEGSRRRNVRDM
jgi:hypothetical protein